MTYLRRLTVAVLLGTPLLSQSVPPRIVPIGDSITEGNSAHPSYRFPLWQQLHGLGYCFDFVGTKRGVYPFATTGAIFDQDHFGFWGETVLDVYNHLTVAPHLFDADFALIELGSNNVILGMDAGMSSTAVAAQVGTELTQLINHLRSASYNANMEILLAKLTPLLPGPSSTGVWTAFDQGIIDTNAVIATLAGPNVRIVDQFSGFVTSSDTYDDVHPNDSGAAKIAAKWATALTSLLGVPAANQPCFHDFGRGAIAGFVWPRLTYSAMNPSLPTQGATITLDMFDLVPSAPALVAVSMPAAATPFVASQAYFWVDTNTYVLLPPLTTSSTGSASCSFTLPGGPTAVGVELATQAFTVGTNPLFTSMTNGGLIRIG